MPGAPISIAGGLLGAGQVILGPFPVPRWSRFSFALDILALVDPLWVLFEHSPDGVSWKAFALADYTAPVMVNGVLVSTADFTILFREQVPGDAPQLRCTLTNTTAFITAGGSVTVS